MTFFRLTNKPVLLLWSLLLSLSLLCAQGAKLHTHNLDHGHNDHPNDYHSHIHSIIDEAGDHGHLSKAHFTHDTSHNDHHDGVISEVDISPDGLLKNANDNVFEIVLFALFFTLMIFVSSRQLVQRCRESKLILHRYYVLSPPLRAPPQH